MKYKVIGYSVDGLMVVAIVTFLVSIITLGFMPESFVLRMTVLASGLGSVAFFVGHLILEYVLAWDW